MSANKTKLPDDAAFCFICGQKVVGKDLVAETLDSVVANNSAQIGNVGQNSEELLAYLKDVWTISQKIIEVDYAIKNQELKYKICNTAAKRRNRVYADVGHSAKQSLQSRRWSTLRSALKNSQIYEMKNVFKNAPKMEEKKKGLLQSLFVDKKEQETRNQIKNYLNNANNKYPYFKWIKELPFNYITQESEILDALYEDIIYVAYPNTLADIIYKMVGNEKYTQVLDNIENQLAELNDLRVQLVELLDKIYAKGKIHPKYQHNYIASAMFCEYIDTKRCSTLDGANGAYNLFENELRMNTIIDKLDVVIDKLDSIDKTMKEISDTLSSMRGLLSSINANTGMIEYNTRMFAMRQDIINVSISVSGRY